MRIPQFMSSSPAMLLIVTLTAISAQAAPDDSLRVSVKGKSLVDATGQPLQLRGVNLSGLEFVAVQGWSPGDPWGGQYWDGIWDVMAKWKINALRIPLNQGSWLGYKCVDGGGKVSNPDPGGNYKETLQRTVDKATEHGMYIILDLHMTAPDDPVRAVNGIKAVCPALQNPMPDADHSIDFWRSLATTFKEYPNVIFELFNEPYFDWKSAFKNDWEILRDGGTFRAYRTSSAFIDNRPWKAAGMQTLVKTVRDTGAKNIVMVSGPNWAQRLDEWIKYKPNDPIGQLAAVWHAYPKFGSQWGTEAHSHPSFDDAYEWAENILDANIPVVITETGDRSANGTVGSPFVANVMSWADKHGVSYLGWTFNVWPQSEDHVLIKDRSGTPTDGYGQYFKKHLECRALGGSNCR